MIEMIARDLLGLVVMFLGFLMILFALSLVGAIASHEVQTWWKRRQARKWRDDFESGRLPDYGKLFGKGTR